MDEQTIALIIVGCIIAFIVIGFILFFVISQCVDEAVRTEEDEKTN
ncbi:MAG: hypothetical protein VZT48_00190 [Bulleidia sp.]|nr:hypothetical protein [Bulleidia sp.]